ncbi:hypothetical protein BACCIP111899_02668 [Bacillus rhizoplanae]|uniref:Phosphoglycolate phosphatase n=1 Tax=Bacillus rhizoplanae TaxID=2880966 RepID=A0ABM8YCJ4_9BACI|nr:phosphoglycolate phosphatase [Bacillus rhizoplanae]CAG9613453.1 hypothetical protein BACCIP111899_02668 [Bacillus rhizoplanae]
MKRILLHPLFVFCSIIILVPAIWMYCVIDRGMPKEFSQGAWPKTEETAKKATIEHFKKEKNVDIVIDKISLSGEYATHEIYIDGHVAGNEQQKISATVNSAENYKVKDTSEKLS